MPSIHNRAPALPNRYINSHNFNQPSFSNNYDSTQHSISQKVVKQLTRDNYKVKDRNGDGQITIGYKFFKPTDREEARLKASGALEFSEARKKAFISSMQAWEDVVKVRFIENAKDADAFVVLHASEGGGGYATLPGDGNNKMQIGIGVTKKNLPLNSSMIHELGHSLGLRHPTENHPTNNKAYTAMSYNTSWWRPFDENGATVSDSTSTPMMLDIAAIQSVYIPNNNTRTGDTTYGFNSNSERDYFSLNRSDDLAAFCVWDNGGNDTLDFSGFTQDQKIDLNAESHSNVGGRVGNVSIAKDVVVENVIGGSGNDELIGNQVNNRITGGAGDDSMHGGGGADTFVYNKASDSTPDSPDTINDFESGVDKIDISRVLKDAGITKPMITSVLTDRAATLSGRKGELVLDYDTNVKMHRLILDVSGNAESVLLILSKNPINPNDLLISSDSQPQVSPPNPDPKPDTTPSPPPVRPREIADTTYGFNPGSNVDENTLYVVHDNAGNDTLDYSTFENDQLIYLTPGATSSIGGRPDNVHITAETVIENAIGGSGNDHIVGNAADNVLVGGAGADILTGNGGYNTFKYHAASDSPRNNADLLMDFTTGKDKIDLREMSKNARVTLQYVNQYTGKAGDTVLRFNPTTNRHFLAIDLTGDRTTDFLIKSTQPISSSDVIGLDLNNDGYL
jgi:Ca2+-binding RTX toxin-like protein